MYTTVPLYRKGDSNSQYADPKSAASAIPPLLHFFREAAPTAIGTKQVNCHRYLRCILGVAGIEPGSSNPQFQVLPKTKNTICNS